MPSSDPQSASNVEPRAVGAKPPGAGSDDPARRALAVSLEIAKNALRAGTLDDVRFILVNDTRALIEFDRSLLILHLGGRSALAAVYNQPELEPKSDFVQQANKLAPALADLNEGRVVFTRDLRKDDGPLADRPALAEYAEYAGCSCVAILPLMVRDHVIGHLFLEFFDNRAPGRIEIAALINVVPFLSQALVDRWIRKHRPAIRRAMDAVVDPNRAAGGRLRRALKWGLLFLIVGVAIVALTRDVPFRVGGRAEIAPRIERYAFPRVDGVIDKVLVQEGDSVKRGEVVAVLDPTDIDYRIREAERLIESYTAEMEILGSLGAEDPAKLAERRLVGIKRRRARLNLEYLKWERTFLDIVSPSEGTVLTDNVRALVGKKFSAGEPFCRIAPSRLMAVEIFVRQSDVGYVRKGQDARMFFDFDPTKGYRLRVTRVSPSAAGKEGIGNVFIIEGDFIDEPPHLRPGMSGIAHILVDERSLWFVLTRRLVTKWNELQLYF